MNKKYDLYIKEIIKDVVFFSIAVISLILLSIILNIRSGPNISYLTYQLGIKSKGGSIAGMSIVVFAVYSFLKSKSLTYRNLALEVSLSSTRGEYFKKSLFFILSMSIIAGFIVAVLLKIEPMYLGKVFENKDIVSPNYNFTSFNTLKDNVFKIAFMIIFMFIYGFLKFKLVFDITYRFKGIYIFLSLFILYLVLISGAIYNLDYFDFINNFIKERLVTSINVIAFKFDLKNFLTNLILCLVFIVIDYFIIRNVDIKD